jgi:carbon storage regulator
MLVIRRRAGEAVLIGDDIEIQVIEISPSRVKLGIVAPPDVIVLRKEIHLAGQQNLAAAQGLSSDAIGRLLGRLARPRPRES